MIRRSAMPLLLILIVISSCGGGGSREVTSANAVAVDRELEGPGGSMTGIASDGDLLWVLDGTSDQVFSINSETGAVMTSFQVSHPPSMDLTSIACSAEHRMILIGAWDGGSSGYVYRYGTDGELLGSVNLCGG